MDLRIGKITKMGWVIKGEEDRKLGFERDTVGCYIGEKFLGLCAEGDEGSEGRCHILNIFLK